MRKSGGNKHEYPNRKSRRVQSDAVTEKESSHRVQSQRESIEIILRAISCSFNKHLSVSHTVKWESLSLERFHILFRYMSIAL